MAETVTELLTVEEFSTRTKIGRSTVYQGIKSGLFRPGEHYVKMGHATRFVWPDAIRIFQQESRRHGDGRGDNSSSVSAPVPAPAPERKTVVVTQKRATNHCPVNLDYGKN